MELYLIDDYKKEFPGLKGRHRTDALLCSIFEQLGVEDPVILRTDMGKPYLKGGEYHFSVSHSGNTFACLVDDVPCGLDIQTIRKVDCMSLSQRFFTEEEAAYIRKNGPGSFFRIWTRKEALAKYTGKGLAAIIGEEDVMNRSDVIFTEIGLGDNLVGCFCCGTEENRDDREVKE